METQTNFVTVGAFVLAGVIGLVVALLWFAGTQYREEYSYYQIYFKGPVTGLGKGTFVRYNGIEVGRITELDFDANDPQSVIVTLEIKPDLYIREDSIATIESQGLAGTNYVEINGGTKSSPLLVAQPGQKYPVIRSRRSPWEQLEQSAPQLLARLNITAERLNDLLDDDNRHNLSQLLANVDDITATVAGRSAQIDSIIQNTDLATDKINIALDSVTPTFADAQLTLAKYGTLANDTDLFINGDALSQVPDLIHESRRLIASFTNLSDEISKTPTVLLFGDRRRGFVPK